MQNPSSSRNANCDGVTSIDTCSPQGTLSNLQVQTEINCQVLALRVAASAEAVQSTVVRTGPKGRDLDAGKLTFKLCFPR